MIRIYEGSTYNTLQVLDSFPSIERYVFTKTKIWLAPTMEKR